MKLSLKLKSGIFIGFTALAVAFLVLRFVSENTRSSERIPKLEVGKTETRSSMTSGQSTSAPEYATFNSGRVLLLSDNPHPFCRKIVDRLEQQLQESPHIRAVERLNEPFTITQRDGAPNLFLRVDLVSAKGSGVLPSTFKSVVTASLGNTPWFDTIHMRGDGSAPVVSMEWNATVDSESTFLGLTTDRYEKAAHDIAQSLAKSMTENLATLSAEHPPLPLLPAEFFGPYEPVADFDWLSTVSARRSASYCGLFTHNETYWRFQTSTNPGPVLEQIAQSLNRAGWEVEPRDLNSTRAARLEARQGEARVNIFRKFRTHTLLDEESSGPRRFEYIVCHRKPLSRTERAQALELLLDRKPWDFETLLPFVHSFEVEQRRRFFERLAQTGSSSPKGCVQLADLFLDQGRTNDARHQLLKAHALSATRPDSQTLKRHIEDLAGKIQPPSRLELEYTPEICRELGFIEIETVTQPMEFTRGFGEPLAFFVRISNPVEPPHTAIRIVALTVRAPMNGICSVEHRSAEKGMHGFGNGAFSRLKSGFQEQTLGGVRKVIVRSEALPDSAGAKFTVRPEPNAEVTP
ncbi:MAG: hypothetical protein NTX70_10515 [Verrucomicrobia bacterium]|nr:hypothetical protein [Verrucomicrobiota bacterium]